MEHLREQWRLAAGDRVYLLDSNNDPIPLSSDTGGSFLWPRAEAEALIGQKRPEWRYPAWTVWDEGSGYVTYKQDYGWVIRTTASGPAIYTWEVTYAENKDALMGKNPDDPDNPDAKLPSQWDAKRVYIEVEGYSELDSRGTAEAIVMNQYGWEPTGAKLVGTKPITRLGSKWESQGRGEWWKEYGEGLSAGVGPGMTRTQFDVGRAMLYSWFVNRNGRTLGSGYDEVSAAEAKKRADEFVAGMDE